MVAVDLLLHTAADIIHGLGAELDHVERIKHRGCVLDLVIDGVLVAVEWVQRGDLDSVAEGLATFFEPVAVRLPRPAGDQVEQSCPRLPGLGIRG